MKYIFLDFNGTIINDVDLCVDLLNQILDKQKKPKVSIQQYKSLFTFPIRKYYELAGVDFTLDSFEDLANWFIKEYQPKSMKCGLYEGLKETFQILKEKGYHLVILSASEKNNLLEQCEHYKISSYFDAILGIDNIQAESKIHIAKNYIQKENIDGADILFVGDTLHDLEVAKAIGANCMLVSCGHQSIDVLKKGNVKIIESVSSLVNLL
ncbi:MAG: HAD family hydrolase [Anaeroplasmataceae bacterium]|nr:HAD family hydrolase [Anaeroplasmataceae bacterium]